MKPLFFVTTLILIAVSGSYINSQPAVYEHSIKFVNSSNATLVGEDGVILKTTDNGLTWSEQTSGVVNTLYGNASFNADTGLAVGENGVVLKTFNGGADWSIITSGVTAVLRDVSVAGTQNAVVCGDSGTILLSTDYGDTWSIVTSNTANNLKDIAFVDQNIGFIIGELSTFLKTTNGGLTWSLIDMQINPRNFNAVFAHSANNIIAAGEAGEIYTTTDGGLTWTGYLSTSYTSDINDVYFVSPTNGVIAGNDGMILITIDGGLTWDHANAPTLTAARDYMSVSFSSAANGIMVGENGTELYTTDGGSSWYESPPEITFYGVSQRNNKELKNIINFPNPFNPSTMVSFVMPQSGSLKVSVYDITGREVSRLFDGYANSGRQEFVFNASNLSSGIYFYSISGEGFKTVTKKMMLVK